MATVHMKRVNAAFILSTANSDRSYSTVTLKESANEYESGEVVVAEYTESVADSGEFDTPTGKFVAATSVADLADYVTVKAAFLVRRTDASEGDVEELVVDADAEVRVSDTTLADLSVTVRAAVEAAVAATGIKLR